MIIRARKGQSKITGLGYGKGQSKITGLGHGWDRRRCKFKNTRKEGRKERGKGGGGEIKPS